MIEFIEGLAEVTKEVAEVASDVAKTTELSTGEIGYIRECVSPLDVEALTTRIESVLDCSLAQAMENCPQIAEMIEPIKDQLPAELLSEGAPMEQGEALANSHYENIDVHERLSKLSDIYEDECNLLSERASALIEMRETLDSLVLTDKDKEFFALSEKVQADLEKFWEKTNRSPKSNGEWREEGKTWFWKPDDSFVPPNKQYSNMWGKNWAQIKLENNIEEIPYKNGIVDFSKMARAKVEIDFPSDYRYDSPNVREFLQEKGFEKLAEKWGCTIDEVKAYKERENLVWHEDVDCKTLYLVPREVHDNVPHFGGISMARIIKGQA